MAGKKVAKPRRMRLLGRCERSIVRDVVTGIRRETTGPISPSMRLVADQIAREVLREDHGIRVSLRTIARIAS